MALRVDEGAKPHARISVRDNGPGIPIELRERIFDPFYRIPSSEHRVPGSGLGLAISRRIAGLLGGNLTVTGAPGGGSDFVLTLPMERQAPPIFQAKWCRLDRKVPSISCSERPKRGQRWRWGFPR